jgi:N-acylglucosamine-6-phosphate 2-epimerase
MAQNPQTKHQSLFGLLHRKLVVSCQADRGDPLDDIELLGRIATSVLRGGAGGLRAEGVAGVSAFRTITKLPIIGMVKTKDSDGEVYITPTFAAASSVAQAGASMIAVDCTMRRLSEAEPWPILIRRIHDELGLPVLADIASNEDAVEAEAAGANAIATTLYGYTAETAGIRVFSWRLLEELLTQVKVPVFAEGHVNQPADVQRALDLGAHCVVVGSAITRPEFITARFVAATKN